ncbi:hypothetical protein MTO96_031314 [Rhipicephalus appendiculatus]
MEKTLQQRARLYNRDLGVSSVSAVSATLPSNVDVLREVVRAVVREELQKLQLTQGPPGMPSLADVVREEVRQAILQPQSQTWGGVALIGWLHTVLLFLVPLARYRAPPETGQAQYFSKKTAATRGHHKSPDSTPGWPSRPLQMSQAARRHANPNEPRQHLRYAASHEALEATNNKHCPGALGQPAAFLSCTHTPATSNAGSVCATPSLKATFQPTCVVTMPTTDNALSAAKMLEPVPVVTQTPAFVVTNASTVAPESESRITASALPSAALAAIPTGSAPVLATVNAESPEKSVLKSGVLLVPTGLPTTILADDTPTEMDFAASQGNDDDASHPEGSWTTVSANRKPASTARPRTELITVGIQLPPGTLTPKLPLYDLLASIIAAANLSPKTSAEVTLQAKPAQSLVFLKTHSPLTAHLLLSLTNLELNGKPIAIKPYAPNPPISCLGVIHNGTVLTSALSTAFRPSAAAVQHLYPPTLLLTFVPNRGASIAK